MAGLPLNRSLELLPKASVGTVDEPPKGSELLPAVSGPPNGSLVVALENGSEPNTLEAEFINGSAGLLAAAKGSLVLSMPKGSAYRTSAF